MKKNSSGFIWGIILILAGLFIAGKAFNLFQFTIFFDGWWTLFIIIPCFIGLFNNENSRMSYLVGLAIGVLLLLSRQDVISWRMFGPLCFAAILVLAGVSIMFRKDNYHEHNHSSDNYTSYQQGSTTYSNDRTSDNTTTNDTETNQYSGAAGGNYNGSGQNSNTSGQGYQRSYGNGHCACTAVLSGKDLRFDNQEFNGAVLSAVLGGIELDLRNAIVRENVVIDVKAVLGGVDIFVPSYARVVIDSTPILGGVDDRTIQPMNADASTPTIFINATCVLAGIDVK